MRKLGLLRARRNGVVRRLAGRSDGKVIGRRRRRWDGPSRRDRVRVSAVGRAVAVRLDVGRHLRLMRGRLGHEGLLAIRSDKSAGRGASLIERDEHVGLAREVGRRLGLIEGLRGHHGRLQLLLLVRWQAGRGLLRDLPVRRLTVGDRRSLQSL